MKKNQDKMGRSEKVVVPQPDGTMMQKRNDGGKKSAGSQITLVPFNLRSKF
jgi:hypothetical protein